MQEERDQIGEALVKGGNIHVGGDLKERSQPVEQRVRRLVHDDVVTERCTDQPLSHHETGRVVSRREIAEREIAGFAAVSRIRAAEAEWANREPQRPALGRRGRPGDIASERLPEGRVGEAADGVDHLHVEVTVNRGRRQPAREQQRRIVEVEGSAAER
jgi:hypothetical protein